MLENNAIKFAFLISFTGHCLFLGAGNSGLPAHARQEKPREIKVELDIKKQALLPRIENMGPQKKFKPMEEKREAEEIRRLKEPPRENEQAPHLKVNSEKAPAEKKPESLSGRQAPQEKIDTPRHDEELMLRYQDMVKQRIEASRIYPLWARKHGIEGVTRIFFIVLPKGEARGISVTASSGSKMLDEESIATVKRAGPFPPVPAGLSSRHISVEVSLVFSLSEREK